VIHGGSGDCRSLKATARRESTRPTGHTYRARNGGAFML
jgi:hypothetical protein